jgi:hypothetical protein
MATIVPSPNSLGQIGSKPVNAEAARRVEASRRLSERIRETNKVEPLPDNFLDICKGLTMIPGYAK